MEGSLYFVKDGGEYEKLGDLTELEESYIKDDFEASVKSFKSIMRTDFEVKIELCTDTERKFPRKKRRSKRRLIKRCIKIISRGWSV